MYNKIDQCDTIVALLALLDKNRDKDRALITGSNIWGVMKKSERLHSALIQNRQFRAHIARKKCGHFNKVGRKVFSYDEILENTF